jgi:hypothetical protein
MVAYNFKVRFVENIRAGLKAHTIRSDRKRHSRPGELMQLQHGSRFKPVRIGVAPCLFATPIRLDFARPLVSIEYIDRINDHLWNRSAEWRADGEAEYLNRFARSDGFEDFADMARFWKAEHKTETFEGVIIGWGTIEAAS